MKGAARGSILIVLVALGRIATAWAQESSDVTDADRVYRNFTREAATVQPGQIRLEVRGMTLEDTGNTFLNLNGFPVGNNVQRIEGGIFDLLTSYGLGKSTEVGAVIPVFTQSTRRTDGTGTTSDTDIGDVQLYGKFKKVVAKNCSVAGGVELSLPTGIEHKTFGTGELGVNPFISTRYQEGRFGFGLHAGYELYSGNVPDIFNYSVEAFVRGSSSYNFHVELSGRLFNATGRRVDDLVAMPGIDFNLNRNFTIRPTGLAGVTGRATDWGIGLGLAYTI